MGVFCNLVNSDVDSEIQITSDLKKIHEFKNPRIHNFHVFMIFINLLKAD